MPQVLIRQPTTKTINKTGLRSKLKDGTKEVSQGRSLYLIVHHGRTEAVMISPQDYEVLTIASQLLADPKVAERLRVGFGQIRQGEVVTNLEAEPESPSATSTRLGAA